MGTKGECLDKKASIKSVSIYLPETQVDNRDLVSRINYDSLAIKNGALERLMGIETRYFASEETQVSDLACMAAEPLLSTQSREEIDLLIFAAASSDLIEPATANIVQSKLGLKCPVMDIKNACNSFLSAIHVASSFVESGTYANVLIVNGEKLSEVINYNPRNDEHLTRCLAAYGLGDAGAAVIIGQGGDGKLIYQKFSSWGEYWNTCTVAGGGSLAFREADKYYFESDSRELLNAFQSKLFDFTSQCFSEAGWTSDEIDCVITHQVSSSTTKQLADILRIPMYKCVNTFKKYGNTAAATIPIALHDALHSGQLKKGHRLCMVGMAAGISISVQLVEW